MCADMETKISSQACKRRSLFLIFFWGELSKLKVQIVKLISSMSEKVAFLAASKKLPNQVNNFWETRRVLDF
jgi:hypothetical protein